VRFNPNKCHISTISGQRSKPTRTYYLWTDPTSSVNSHRYLGVTVYSGLKWHEHISNVSIKATRTLNFVRRNTYCCSKEARNLTSLFSPSPFGVCRCSVGSLHGQRHPPAWRGSTSCCSFRHERLLSLNLCL